MKTTEETKRANEEKSDRAAERLYWKKENAKRIIRELAGK